jgi:uncharacterized protein YbbK (DUF523 family)
VELEKMVQIGYAKILVVKGTVFLQILLFSACLSAINLIKDKNITKAILYEKSPTCGVNKIYDGSFNRQLIDGSVFTALLKKQGVKCYSHIAL